tara:strand:+ start:94 stop:504 length:411 start_codon:yes stop_codon:yes gene_type:complete
MSFIDEMITLSTEKKIAINNTHEQSKKMFEQARDKRVNEIMVFLTEKYHNKVKTAIIKASTHGHREKYMNFNREDFKANFPTLGSPAIIISRWLTEMTNPESPYLPISEDSGCKDHFNKLQFSVWNNGAFTVHFSW